MMVMIKDGQMIVDHRHACQWGWACRSPLQRVHQSLKLGFWASQVTVEAESRTSMLIFCTSKQEEKNRHWDSWYYFLYSLWPPADQEVLYSGRGWKRKREQGRAGGGRQRPATVDCERTSAENRLLYEKWRLSKSLHSYSLSQVFFGIPNDQTATVPQCERTHPGFSLTKSNNWVGPDCETTLSSLGFDSSYIKD